MRNFMFLLGLMFFFVNSPAQSYFNDCTSPYTVCTKGATNFKQLFGPGNNANEVGNIGCFSFDYPEYNNIWIKWEVDKAGSIEFDLIPYNPDDDIDFVLFKALPNNGCSSLEELRCMVSGRNLGETYQSFAHCLGATGIGNNNNQSAGFSGCSNTDNNYLSSVNVLKGETYFLFIANYDSNGGFLFDLKGSFEPSKINCSEETAVSGVDELTSNGQINISPNPVRNEIQLQVNSHLSQNAELDIFNSNGVLVKSFRAQILSGTTELAYNLSELSSGNYFLRIRGEHENFLSSFYKL